MKTGSQIKTVKGLLVWLVVVMWLVAGCGQQAAVLVATPSIGEPKVGAPSPQQPGEEIGISIEIASTGGVTLNYAWTADGGEIVRGQGSPAITYRVPEEAGTYNVRVKIEWEGQSIEKVTSIRVEGASVTETATPRPPASTPVPEPTNTPLPVPTETLSTNTPVLAMPTATPKPTSTATSQLTGTLDTGMGGSLSIQGVVRDSFGNVASNVRVHLTVFEETVFWDTTGSSYHRLGEWNLDTDKTGYYSFNNLPRAEKGHYEVWFSGLENEYEGSGYYIMEEESVHLLYIGEGNSRTHFSYYLDQERYIYTLDVTVHRVTNSVLCAAIQYKDADGVIKNYLSTRLGPDHRLELNRGTSPDSAGHEYTIGDGGFTSDGRTACLRGLAGGTYYLVFQYHRSDGIGVSCESPSFEIPTGETKQFEYTIQDCSP